MFAFVQVTCVELTRIPVSPKTGRGEGLKHPLEMRNDFCFFIRYNIEIYVKSICDIFPNDKKTMKSAYT